MPSPRASNHELTWASVAPTAPAAWKTMTAALAKPTSTVTNPATTAETERSRTSDMKKTPPTIAMVRSGPTGGSGTLPGMRAYLLSRLGQTLLVVFLSLTAVFFLVRLGGDPVLLFLPMDIQAKDLNEFRQRLGFNDPLAVQYGRFMGRALHGDFGESLRYKNDALQLVLGRLPATLSLALAALLLTFCVAVPVGVFSAVRRGSLFDLFGMTGAVLGQAVPGFWLGLMMIYLFSVRLGWLPTGGMGGPLHFVMPCVVLASFYAARMARLTRSSVLDTLNEEFVLTARAKGLAERIVIGKHTLKNSAIPLVTLAGLDTGQLLGGAVITETIFAWPGLGRLTVQALLNRDFPVVLAAVFVFSVTYTLINFAVDLLYGWLDPRTRRQRA
jgi:peptide/nickel transport system permease protein